MAQMKTLFDELGMVPVPNGQGGSNYGMSDPSFGPGGRVCPPGQVSDIPAPDPTEAFVTACEGRVPYGCQQPLRFQFDIALVVPAQLHAIGPLQPLVPWALIADLTTSTAGRLFEILGPQGKTITAEGTNILQTFNISDFTAEVLRSGYNPLNRVGRIDNTKPMQLRADGAVAAEVIAGVFYCYRV